MALLAGCATPAPDPEVQNRAWQAHQAWLGQLSDWRTSGKVAVDVPSDSWSANLRWRQRAERYAIWLGGPFGQGAVNIEGDADAVTLRTAEGREARAATPEQLVAAELGAEVPISGLRYWILGRPAPDLPVTAIDLDADGRLAGLVQAGWQVRYRDYAEAGAGYLPTGLDIRRDEVQVRLVLGRWRLGG